MRDVRLFNAAQEIPCRLPEGTWRVREVEVVWRRSRPVTPAGAGVTDRERCCQLEGVWRSIASMRVPPAATAVTPFR
jgi:hypothetical protein